VAGDVVLMHPWTFHAPAPNCGAKPRIMVGHSVYRNTARHLN
jgi:ectoine hydroxylase-related dioxygenase (phytanoyl-CoA dioxygenase family)